MESELQEVCLEVELTSRQGLKNSLECMTAETLRVLCQAEGFSEVGAKKELVERLVGRVVSKAKGKGRVEGCSQDRDFWDERMSLESEDVVRDTDEKRIENEANAEVQNDSLSDSRYIVLEKLLEKTVQATLGKALEDFKSGASLEATRAFMLRVANKERWNVAASIKNPANDDPIEAYFHEKLANARQSARNK
ncbi:13260_t:CDS:2 [Cetraspora pellucida]|uniref:13260_t:CDS:1 n=1 Tax=Cetraspora pellucida TaxID=1433469 RepID=A0A9N9JEC4_9GLOM|nr:13260_t:CDS:2 [Cetraspora pellucida]